MQQQRRRGKKDDANDGGWTWRGNPLRPKTDAFLLVVSVLILLFAACGTIYIYAFHRIKTVQDVMSILKTTSLPLVDDRCRKFNSTHLQCLPNVFFIGASKCGTTSITEYLDRHPQVHFVRRRIHRIDRHREVHRFDRNTYSWAIRALELWDEWASSPLVPSATHAVIHYTPHYLYAPTVPFDLRRLFPESLIRRLKFIIILRNPTRRAISSYWFQNSHIFHKSGDRGNYAQLSTLCDEEIHNRKAYEHCMYKFGANPYSSRNASGASLLTRELGGTKRLELERALENCFGALLHSTALGGRHVDKGIYYDQLNRWFANFPRENFFITSLEKWTEDSHFEFSRLLSFIGVDPNLGPSSNSLGINGTLARLIKPNRLRTEPPPAELQQRLDSFFLPYNDLLKSLRVKLDS